jgi:hypothetical protein
LTEINTSYIISGNRYLLNNHFFNCGVVAGL